jgi:hypothetical protein
MTKRKSKPQPKTFNPHHQELVSLFHHPGINIFPTPNIGLALAHLPCCWAETEKYLWDRPYGK